MIRDLLRTHQLVGRPIGEVEALLGTAEIVGWHVGKGVEPDQPWSDSGRPDARRSWGISFQRGTVDMEFFTVQIDARGIVTEARVVTQF